MYRYQCIDECMGSPCIPSYRIRDGFGCTIAVASNAAEAKFLVSILNSATPEQIAQAREDALSNAAA